MKDYAQYNKTMHEKTYNYFQEKYHKVVKWDGEVPSGFYKIQNQIGKECQELLDVMNMEGTEQIIEILEMLYDQRIDMLNADLDEKKVPKELRFIKSYEMDTCQQLQHYNSKEEK